MLEILNFTSYIGCRCAQLAAEWGCTSALLHVDADNAVATGLYAKARYRLLAPPRRTWFSFVSLFCTRLFAYPAPHPRWNAQFVGQPVPYECMFRSCCTIVAECALRPERRHWSLRCPPIVWHSQLTSSKHQDPHSPCLVVKLKCSLVLQTDPHSGKRMMLKRLPAAGGSGRRDSGSVH